MDVRTALQKIRSQFPDYDVVGCIDYDDLYVFELIPKGADLEKDMMFLDPFHSVHKKTGQISGFSPLVDMEGFMTAKRIKIDA